jgi:endoglucanase
MRNRFSQRMIVVATALSIGAILSVAQATTADSRFLTGVNIAGAEFNGKTLPGIAGKDYFYPKPGTLDHFASEGMNVIRVPFRWERIQPSLNGELDAAEYRRLADTVHEATAKKLFVILDVHNYAAYRGAPIGSPDVPVSAFANLWKRLAGKFRKETQVGFGLMNEPKGLPTETWLAATNAAIAQIRAAGAKNLVFVPGNGWTGAHSWFGKSYGTPNAAVMLGVNDPADNYVYELHQYLDSNYSGTHAECKNETVGVTTLTAVTDWLRQHHKRGFLGEFGAGSNPTCMAALDAMLGYIDRNRDAWLGWTYWAAGAWPARYFTSVQPIDGADTPQMRVLLKHVARARPDRAANP